MINRSIVFVRRSLFLIFILSSVQVLSIAQTDPDTPQTLSFKEAKIKTVLRVLGRQMKLEVAFDESVRDLPVTIDMEDVTVRQGVEVILKLKKLDVKMKDDHTLFVFADTPENQDKYAEMESWSKKNK